MTEKGGKARETERWEEGRQRDPTIPCRQSFFPDENRVLREVR
jgi:hypothetical protein